MNILYDFYVPSKRTQDPITIVSNTDKSIKLRHGWAYKGASDRNSSKEEVISLLNKSKTVIIEDHEHYLLVNTFSSSDLD